MSRHFWRACDREGGFTFVELLVTIIIAGLAFAAMVPVFVQAQQVSSGEVMRNAALQLAQDKLEKVRGLDYDVIKETDLANDAIPNGDFGSPVSWSTGGGGSRDFAVVYRVELIDVNGNPGATPGTEKYKQVTITTSWTAPPKPVRPVVLSTMISKQYAGPQIIRFNVGPSTVLAVNNGVMEIQSGPVELDAYISAEDIQSMNQDDPVEENRGYVKFTVIPLNGTAVADQAVTVPFSSTEPARYHFEWDNSSVPDGTYIFQVVAAAGTDSKTQGVPWSYVFDYTSHSPAAPTNLKALPGDGVVTLTWTTPSIGDLDRYEVYRSTDNVTFAHIGDATETTSYPDTAVTNGTTYYYKVRTVDTEGYSGPYTSVISATPIVSGDVTPPSIPAPLTATPDAAAASVHLTWATSTDVGSPASGLAGYTVQRQLNGSPDWEDLQVLYQGTVYDDTTPGWSTTYTYRVVAVDLANNSSDPAVAGPVTTAAAIPRMIAVTNNSSTQSYAWVLNTQTSMWYTTSGTGSATRPSGVWVKKNGNTVTWNNVPSGLYQVYYMPSATFNLANALKLVAVNANAGDGTASYP